LDKILPIPLFKESLFRKDGHTKPKKEKWTKPGSETAEYPEDHLRDHCCDLDHFMDINAGDPDLITHSLKLD
jgi:hypothetical protein